MHTSKLALDQIRSQICASGSGADILLREQQMGRESATKFVLLLGCSVISFLEE